MNLSNGEMMKTYQHGDITHNGSIPCVVCHTPRVEIERLEEELRLANLQLGEVKATLQKALDHIDEGGECTHSKNWQECMQEIRATLAEKRIDPSPNCKCPCHQEIKRIGYGSPCGLNECAPCGRV